MKQDYLFTSESVSEGHPDKVADFISDAVLDAFLAKDPEARVAIETLVTTNLVVLAGEKRSKYTPDYEQIVKDAIDYIGYKSDDFSSQTVEIINHIHEQSTEIAQGVDAGEDKPEGAGDQGLMFGYATNETPSFMPAPIYYAHLLMEEMAKMRHKGDERLLPDAKSQVTLVYRNNRPVAADTIVISHQHRADVSQEEVKEIAKEVINSIFPTGWINENTKLFINPTGSFIMGGPAADTGLTGRKIIVDTYGGASRHGGGAFSGKDPTKVDRSAAYMARYLAKNIVAAKLAKCCEIQLCYAIGVAEPLAIYLDTFETAKEGVSEAAIVNAIQNSVSLTPQGIREHLQLNKPIYRETSAYGHFGRTPSKEGHFSWEKTDLADIIISNLDKEIVSAG